MGGPLKEQVAVVTGGGTGIGRATALRLAGQGAHVVVAGRRRAPLEAVAAEIRTAGGRVSAQRVDLTRRDSIHELARWAEAEAGPVSILINNAGAGSKVRNLQWIEQADWDSTLAVNLTAVYAMIQEVLPGMLARGGGTIVTVASIAAHQPGLLSGAPYGASKAGVCNLMAYLRNAFRSQNIRAITIVPGEVDTPILDGRPRPPTREERARMVDADDVARAIELCCVLPSRTTIEELVIAPTLVRDLSRDIEFNRWFGAPDNAPGRPRGA